MCGRQHRLPSLCHPLCSLGTHIGGFALTTCIHAPLAERFLPPLIVLLRHAGFSAVFEAKDVRLRRVRTRGCVLSAIDELGGTSAAYALLLLIGGTAAKALSDSVRVGSRNFESRSNQNVPRAGNILPSVFTFIVRTFIVRNKLGNTLVETSLVEVNMTSRDERRQAEEKAKTGCGHEKRFVEKHFLSKCTMSLGETVKRGSTDVAVEKI